MTLRRLVAQPWGPNAPATEILPGGVSAPIVEIDDVTGVIYVGGAAVTSGGGGGTIIGSGTIGTIPSWTGANSLGNSQASEIPIDPVEGFATLSYGVVTGSTISTGGAFLQTHVAFSTGYDAYCHDTTNNNLGRCATVNFFKSKGTQASPAAVAGTLSSPEALGRIRFAGYNGTVYIISNGGAAIEGDATETWITNTNLGACLKFFATNNGSATRQQVLYIGDNGNNKNHLVQVAPNAAPVDSNLIAGQLTMWLDEIGNNLVVRIRYSNNTLKTATIPLT